MATYTFFNTHTQEEFDLEMPMADRELYLERNPHIEQRITKALGIGDAVRLGFVKPSEGFRDLLRTMKKKHPRGEINIL
jgi:hypothetical protein